MRAVSESVLLEALEQIEATWENLDYETGGDCTACGGALLPDDPHKPDCRYVRVRDALRRVLG
jgi:hypothetical protein